MRTPPASSFGGGTSPTEPAMKRPPMRTTLPVGPDASAVLLRTSNTMVCRPVYGRGSACSTACKHVVGDPLRGDPQAPEVRGAAHVQLQSCGLVRGRRVEVAALHDLLQQPFVRSFTEGVRGRVGQHGADRSRPLLVPGRARQGRGR